MLNQILNIDQTSRIDSLIKEKSLDGPNIRNLAHVESAAASFLTRRFSRSNDNPVFTYRSYMDVSTVYDTYGHFLSHYLSMVNTAGLERALYMLCELRRSLHTSLAGSNHHVYSTPSAHGIEEGGAYSHIYCMHPDPAISFLGQSCYQYFFPVTTKQNSTTLWVLFEYNLAEHDNV